MIAQLIHLTWFLGSELVADLKAKTKSSTPRGSPGTGLPTPGLGCLWQPLEPYGKIFRNLADSLGTPIFSLPLETSCATNGSKLEIYLCMQVLSRVPDFEK